MQLAANKGVATIVAGALFSAYFEQGRDIGDVSVLADIAGENGLVCESVTAFLAGDEGAHEVRAAQQTARDSGVQSVPQFDIGGEVVSGAPSVEHMTRSLRRLADISDISPYGAR